MDKLKIKVKASQNVLSGNYISPQSARLVSETLQELSDTLDKTSLELEDLFMQINVLQAQISIEEDDKNVYMEAYIPIFDEATFVHQQEEDKATLTTVEEENVKTLTPIKSTVAKPNVIIKPKGKK